MASNDMVIDLRLKAPSHEVAKEVAKRMEMDFDAETGLVRGRASGIVIICMEYTFMDDRRAQLAQAAGEAKS